MDAISMLDNILRSYSRAGTFHSPAHYDEWLKRSNKCNFYCFYRKLLKSSFLWVLVDNEIFKNHDKVYLNFWNCFGRENG